MIPIKSLFCEKKIQLYNEDCVKVLQQMQNESIDFTITSPPYDNLRKYNNTLEWNEKIWKQVIEELHRVTKKGGVVVWIVGDATVKGSETGSSFKQALHFKESGFNLHDTMIWEKASRIPTQDRYYNVIEYMFVFSKGKPKSMNFIVDHMNKTFGQKKRKDKVINKGNNIKSQEYLITPKYSRRSNIWKYGTRGNGTTHPAIFPIKLAIDHIISWSNENDLVLDPFMGSGTVGVACLKLNRKFIGIEKVPEYFSICVNRLNKEVKE